MLDGRTLVRHPTTDYAIDVGSSLPAYQKLDPSGADLVASMLGRAGAGSWVELMNDWDNARDCLLQMIDGSENGNGWVTVALADVKLGPPLPSARGRIFALGGNFSKHLADASKTVYGEDSTMYREVVLKRREQGPWGFLTLPETVVGHGAIVEPPPGLTKVDYEGEVAVVLFRGGRSIGADDVRIWGFTAWNDFSLRDASLGLGPPYDGGPMNWTLQKNFDTGSSGGPWLVVGEENSVDVDQLSIELRVNGTIRQEGSTSDMIFSFAETAEHLSHFLTLRAGDMIASGTPAGTALESGADGPFLTDGDVTEVEVEGVGVLANTVHIRKERK